MLTGGYDGEVRLWQIGKHTQKLTISQRVHKAPITGVRYMNQDNRACSSAINGEIIVWDLTSTKDRKPLTPIA
jgi:WD40 repeat protein